jgi:hypothetical protein
MILIIVRRFENFTEGFAAFRPDRSIAAVGRDRSVAAGHRDPGRNRDRASAMASFTVRPQGRRRRRQGARGRGVDKHLPVCGLGKASAGDLEQAPLRKIALISN